MGNKTNRALRAKAEKARKQRIPLPTDVASNKAALRQLCAGIDQILADPEAKRRLRDANMFSRLGAGMADGANELQRKRGYVVLGDDTQGRAALIPGTPMRAGLRYGFVTRTTLIPRG